MIATADGKSCQVKFPPSQRDFEVHRFLIAEGGTTRAAAARFGVSQTRVRQLSRRVTEWAAEVLPPGAEVQDAGLLRVAEAVASDRLEHFYQETMEQWRQAHQPKWLNLAIRVTMASAKLPHRAYEIEAAAADAWEAEERRGSGVGDRGSEAREPRPMVATLVSPPAGDCSTKTQASVAAHDVPQRERIVSGPQPGKLERLLAEEGRSKDNQDARVRALLSPVGGTASGGSGVTAESLGLSVEDVLTRQQRRSHKAK
jgi:hypothetical protein